MLHLKVQLSFDFRKHIKKENCEEKDAFDVAVDGPLDDTIKGAPESTLEGEPKDALSDLYKDAKLLMHKCVLIGLSNGGPNAALEGVLDLRGTLELLP